MKKFFTFITAVCCALSVAAETEFTFTAASDKSQTKDGFSISLAQGSNPSDGPKFTTIYLTGEPEMRLYVGNTITVSGENLTNIQMVFAKSGASNKDYAGLDASVGTLVSGGTSENYSDWKVDTWTGSATNVVFTLSGKGQRRIQRILIDGEPIVLDSIVEVLPTEEDLDPAYTYAEPTVVFPKDTVVAKAEYAFIHNNILVHCTQGSIMKEVEETDDTEGRPAFFNCNAGFALSFTASKPIKGLVISGMVRKLFDAEVDHGTIEFCSPGELEEDHEGNPVVIIKDINSTSVTISCPKQVRCYAVRVYFDANPTEELDCGGEDIGGETFFLTFDKADAVYESEISEDEGKPNYTIYLMQEANPEYPYITLDLYPTAKGDLTGTYEMENGSLGEATWYQYGESALDRTWMDEDGMVAVSKEGTVYTISGFLTCDDTNTYNISFTGEIPFYTDEEYYTEDIRYVNDAKGATKIIRNGQLIILRGNKQYNAQGAQL